MNYYIQRGVQQYGPYSLADLQLYLKQGNIVPTDLARSDGMTDWVPVSQIVGNVAAAPAANPYSTPAAPAAYGAVGPQAAPMVSYGAPGVYGAAAPGYGVAPQQLSVAGGYSSPPSLHWAIVLLISFFCTLFLLVWLFIQLAWVQKVRPRSYARALHIGALATLFCGIVAGFAIAAASNGDSSMAAAGGLLMVLAWLVGVVLAIMGNFSMRSAIQDYYNREEPIGLRLSGVMTFFFSVFYFQYHFTRITEMKQQAAAMQYPGAYRPQ